jgi:hypothetical protein
MASQEAGRLLRRMVTAPMVGIYSDSQPIELNLEMELEQVGPIGRAIELPAFAPLCYKEPTDPDPELPEVPEFPGTGDAPAQPAPPPMRAPPSTARFEEFALPFIPVRFGG